MVSQLRSVCLSDRPLASLDNGAVCGGKLSYVEGEGIGGTAEEEQRERMRIDVGMCSSRAWLPRVVAAGKAGV